MLIDFQSISEEEAKRRPSIRSLTVHYVLSQLKYLHEGGKADLLKTRPLCTALFSHLQYDPPDIVNEILDITEQHVFKDTELPRSAKAALLVQQNLERVLELATRTHQGHPASNRAFSWLKAVCTSQTYGILRESGWYPPGTTSSDVDVPGQDIIDLGLDSVDFYDQGSRPDLRNTTLLSWMRTLRPHSNIDERHLVLTCFEAAPELVAPYILEMSVQLEPKLTNTWIGYVSFLFEVVQLPVPHHMGNVEAEWADLPPQTNIMIESVLPKPLTQKLLTRCLNQGSDLVTFFAVRVLVLAFDKLALVRSQFFDAGLIRGPRIALWHEASKRLQALFVERIPLMKDIIAAFRRTPDDGDHLLQREATTRLLQQYYEHTSIQAMQEQFDVSTALAGSLARRQSETIKSGIAELDSTILGHLLEISDRSPGMRWFNKQGFLIHAPITTLLLIHSRDPQNRQLRRSLYAVLIGNSIFDETRDCDALIASLIHLNIRTPVAQFLDDCFTRAVRQPVKYLDDLQALVARIDYASVPEKVKLSLNIFTAVLLEQVPFVSSSLDSTKHEVLGWTSSFICLMKSVQSGREVLLQDQSLIEALHGLDMNSLVQDPAALLRLVELPESDVGQSEDPSDNMSREEETGFPPPEAETTDHPEIFRWAQRPLDVSLEEHDIERLVLCLCSQYQDIRAQALSQLKKLEHAILESFIENKDPIYVLIGELIETYEQHYLPESEALPYVAGAFATHALRVQQTPMHAIYPKINRYLNKGPEWRVKKLPTYWIDNTIHSQPEEDDGYWKEAQWVIDWLVDGLRTIADLEILQRAGVFERLMSFCSSPGVSTHRRVEEKTLELLWRAMCLDGGSMTLLTRTGLLSWLESRAIASSERGFVMKEKLLASCDQAQLERWSGVERGSL